MPYVKEYEDGTLVGALTKSLADRLIADLAERSPSYVKKARQFHPSDPSRVRIGSRPSYPTRTIAAAALDSYFRAVEAMRAAFVQAERRQPTADDENYTSALDELYEQHLSRSSKWAPVKKQRGGLGSIRAAMQGERVVIGGDQAAPVRKTSGGSGLVSSAIHKSMTAPSPNGRVVMTDRPTRR